MHLSKEEEILFQHYKDLIQTSYQRGIPVFSHFAGYHDIELGFLAMEEFYGKNGWREHLHYELFGGYEEAERKVFCFRGEDYVGDVMQEDFPIACVKISPANKRFCDQLNHRDYLGTIMGLGLTRDQIGDILVEQDNVHNACTSYVFCKSDKAELLCDISRIRHTTVQAEIIDFRVSGWKASFREIRGSVSSFRLDAVLALAVRVSRSQGLALIQGGNVVLNGRCCTENAKKLQEGDVFSIRGYGKFIFEQTTSMSKKGRYQITIKQYI